MDQQSPFKWLHFEVEIILLCVGRYLQYARSYRDLEMMAERGLQVDHTTIYRLQSSVLLWNSTNAAARMSKPALLSGKSTRRTSKSKQHGCISTELSIQKGTPWRIS
jgi:transposase-like protein